MLQRLKEAVAQHPRSLPLQIAIIQSNKVLQRPDHAAQAAESTLAAFPTSPDAARFGAVTLRDIGKLAEATEAARKWRERAQENPRPADAMIAELLLAQDQPAQALRQLAPYAEALKSDPDPVEPMLPLLLRAYAATGQEKQARAILEPRLSQDLSARVVWLQLAESNIRDGDEAVAWVRQVEPLLGQSIQERTALAAAWYGISVKHRREEGAVHAAKVLDALIQKPDAAADALFLRAAVADRLSDPKTAEDCYRRGLSLQADSPEGLNNLAYLILLRDGDLNEARQLASRAVALAPGRPGFHDTFARVLAQQGEHDAAMESFNRALKLDPTHLESLLGLAGVLAKSGKPEQAVALLPRIEKLLGSEAGFPPQMRDELDALRALAKRPR